MSTNQQPKPKRVRAELLKPGMVVTDLAGERYTVTGVGAPFRGQVGMQDGQVTRQRHGIVVRVDFDHGDAEHILASDLVHVEVEEVTK